MNLEAPAPYLAVWTKGRPTVLKRPGYQSVRLPATRGMFPSVVLVAAEAWEFFKASSAWKHYERQFRGTVEGPFESFDPMCFNGSRLSIHDVTPEIVKHLRVPGCCAHIAENHPDAQIRTMAKRQEFGLRSGTIGPCVEDEQAFRIYGLAEADGDGFAGSEDDNLGFSAAELRNDIGRPPAGIPTPRGVSADAFVLGVAMADR